MGMCNDLLITTFEAFNFVHVVDFQAFMLSTPVPFKY